MSMMNNVIRKHVSEEISQIMTSIDVDSVNIREFSIGNFSDVPSIKIRFDGLHGDIFSTMLFLLMIISLLIACIHLVNCNNACEQKNEKTTALTRRALFKC